MSMYAWIILYNLLFKKFFFIAYLLLYGQRIANSKWHWNKHFFIFYICGLAGLAGKTSLNVALTLFLGSAGRLGQALLMEWQKLKRSRGDVRGIFGPRLDTGRLSLIGQRKWQNQGMRKCTLSLDLGIGEGVNNSDLIYKCKYKYVFRVMHFYVYIKSFMKD